jgi:hypothetical protein
MTEPKIELKKIQSDNNDGYLFRVEYRDAGVDCYSSCYLPSSIIDSIISTFNKGLEYDELVKEQEKTLIRSIGIAYKNVELATELDTLKKKYDELAMAVINSCYNNEIMRCYWCEYDFRGGHRETCIVHKTQKFLEGLSNE